MEHYDAIIIGAGLSGLAAGIRLSHYGQKVLILEAHSRAGGLNSYYSRVGREIDAGLHAMTNFVPSGTRGAPLTKLLRQLRIKHSELDLVEQSASSVSFPSQELVFTNDLTDLRNNIALKFPQQLEGFDRLVEELDNFEETALEAEEESARAHLSKHITDNLLADMLLAPLMYYGNPQEHDMDWAHFAVMWKSVFSAGFCRPAQGMKFVIELLLKKYEENSGMLLYNTEVTNLAHTDGKITRIFTADGKEFSAAKIYSSAGHCETMRLCGKNIDEKAGQLSFAELVLFLNTQPSELGYDKCITFFSQDDHFTFNRSTELIDCSSGVLCCPNNFRYIEPLKEGQVRVTMKAGYPLWRKLDKEEYAQAKEDCAELMIRTAEKFIPGLSDHIVFKDMFTPLTIKRYTRHIHGAIYGAPQKNRPAVTEFENLFLIGTDQGFLGIVGALLSGITVANLHGLK